MGQSNVAGVALFAVLLAGCGSVEDDIREVFANQPAGTIRLPEGVIEIHEELRTAPGAHDLEITGSNTTLKPASDFQGRALLVIEGARNVTIRDLDIDGNREEIAKPFEAAPPENAFRVWYRHNGILADQVEGLEMNRVRFANVVHFPVLVSRSQEIRIHDVSVTASGNYNARGKTNLSGGILIEEGSSDFEIYANTLKEVAGNAIWTHSLFTSPRLRQGAIAENKMEEIGLDAIQVGHATNVRVERNQGYRIGFPAERVDVENGRIPVALDTAGNVDASGYVFNKFEEINGKCIDLDGFHDGLVQGNTCTNIEDAAHYPHGHYGIVMNNSHPEAHSQNIELRGNTVEGAKFGGIYVMGSGHTITGNRFLRINIAGCNENKDIDCIYKGDEPELLQSGIYLGRGVARAEDTRGNEIHDNRVTGHRMETRCVAYGPGVDPAANSVSGNECLDVPARP